MKPNRMLAPAFRAIGGAAMTLAIAFGIAILGASGAGDGADGSTEQWDGIPPTSQSYEACRDALRARVVELLDALAEKGKRR